MRTKCIVCYARVHDGLYACIQRALQCTLYTARVIGFHRFGAAAKAVVGDALKSLCSACTPWKTFRKKLNNVHVNTHSREMLVLYSVRPILLHRFIYYLRSGADGFFPL